MSLFFQNKILVISQQRRGNKIRKYAQLSKKKAEKEEKSEQRADLTSRKRRARLCVKTNHINNYVKCKFSKHLLKCGNCLIRQKSKSELYGAQKNTLNIKIQIG